MKEKHLRLRHLERVLKIIKDVEPDAEIGDNSLIEDVYYFKRGRELHVYYSLYMSSIKAAFIKYK